MEKVLDEAKRFLEKARTSTGRERSDAVFECEGVLFDADLNPEDLLRIGTNRQELNQLIAQGEREEAFEQLMAHKEEAKEALKKARSSEGRERVNAVMICLLSLGNQVSYETALKEIDTTIIELRQLSSLDLTMENLGDKIYDFFNPGQ